MKTIFKIIALAGAIYAVGKFAQIAIDVLYNNSGKRYFTTQTNDN